MESVLAKIRFLLFEQPGGTFHPNGECFFSRKEARDNGYVYISFRTPWHANPTTTTVHRGAKMLQHNTIFLEKKWMLVIYVIMESATDFPIYH